MRLEGLGLRVRVCNGFSDCGGLRLGIALHSVPVDNWATIKGSIYLYKSSVQVLLSGVEVKGLVLPGVGLDVGL